MPPLRAKSSGSLPVAGGGEGHCCEGCHWDSRHAIHPLKTLDDEADTHLVEDLTATASNQSNRKALSFDAAKAEILRMNGSQFAPMAVAAFLAEEPALREMVELKCHATLPV